MHDYEVMNIRLQADDRNGRVRLSKGYRIVAVLDTHRATDKIWYLTVLVECPVLGRPRKEEG